MEQVIRDRTEQPTAERMALTRRHNNEACVAILSDRSERLSRMVAG
jgi:hypothetical protein